MDLGASHPWLAQTIVADIERDERVTRNVLLRRSGFVHIRGEGAWPPERPELSYISGNDEQGRVFVFGPMEPGPLTL